MTRPHDASRNHPLSRRDLLQYGAAAMGVGALGLSSTAGASPQSASCGHFDVKAFGATGVRDDNATQAMQAAIDACTSAGGGTVYVPPGAYTIGTVQLKDNVTLEIEGGATLFLLQDSAGFRRGRRAMIFAENANNIAVTGRGRLDGLAQYVFSEMRGVDPEITEEIEIARAAGVDMRRYYRTGVQTYMFILDGCRNILLRGISIENSPLWNVRLNDCDRVHVEGVYIHSDLEKGVNADGIDIVSSRNVVISDSVIETADDAIVLKTIARDGHPARPTENVTVSNCVLTSSSTALMIGTETQADIRHVAFSNCVIRNSNKGLGINVQDGATVSDVIYSHLTIETNRRHWNWWGSAELCKFVLKKRTPTSPLGAIRDIAVDAVTAHVRGSSTIAGHPDQALENIRMSNVTVEMLTENAPDKRASHGLAIERVRGLRLRDLAVRWSDERREPKWQSALVLRRVSDFVVDGFTGRQGLPDGEDAAVVLDQTTGGVVRNARGAAGCRKLIYVRGETTRDITIKDSHVPRGGAAVTIGKNVPRQAVRIS